MESDKIDYNIGLDENGNPEMYISDENGKISKTEKLHTLKDVMEDAFKKQICCC